MVSRRRCDGADPEFRFRWRENMTERRFAQTFRVSSPLSCCRCKGSGATKNLARPLAPGLEAFNFAWMFCRVSPANVPKSWGVFGRSGNLGLGGPSSFSGGHPFSTRFLGGAKILGHFGRPGNLGPRRIEQLSGGHIFRDFRRCVDGFGDARDVSGSPPMAADLPRRSEPTLSAMRTPLWRI
jgi:hypothetical protein